MFIVLCQDSSLSSDSEVYAFNESDEARNWLVRKHVVRGECDAGFTMEAHDVVESSNHADGETRYDHFTFHHGAPPTPDCVWCEQEEEEEQNRRIEEANERFLGKVNGG